MMEDTIRQEAIAAYPLEAVWLVTSEGFYQVENVHEEPENYFKVSLQDTVQAHKKGIIAVIHSHCDGAPVPSADDMQSQVLMGVPWGVLNTDGETATPITWWGGEDIPALEDRPFIHGVSDCYSLVRDYFRLQGRNVPEVPRDWEWWESSDLLTEAYQGVGFEKIPAEDAREGDVWVAQVGGNVPHHCGVLLDNDLILHHPGSGEPLDKGKLSIREPIYRYLPFIVMYWRLK